MISKRVLFALLLSALVGPCFADAPTVGVKPAGATVTLPSYRLQPGDVITVSVWKETDLQTDVLIRPDGGFSFALAGDVDAVGKTVEEFRAILVERLERCLPNHLGTEAGN